MTKIHYDSDTLTYNVHPNIDEAKKQISKALNTLYYTSVPYGFNYKSTIDYTYPRDLNAVYQNLQNLDSWIKQCENKIENAKKIYEEKLKKINVTEIKERQKIV